MKYDEIVTLLKNASTTIQIQVTFPLPPNVPPSVYAVKCKRTTVSLIKDDDSLGMVIRGGIKSNKAKSRPLTITSIRQGGAAHRAGHIRTGDRVVSINGVNVITYTLEQARRLINASAHSVNLVIEYDIAIMAAVQNADGPLLVEIGRRCGNDIGIVLDQKLKDGKQIIFIHEIKTASVAERCGALHVGDHILAIDGVELNNVSKAEAEHFISNSTSKVLQLEILPVGHLLPQNITNHQQIKNEPSSDCPLDNSFYSVFSEEQFHITDNRSLKPVKPAQTDQKQIYKSFQRHPLLRSLGSITSAAGHSIMCHEELLEICLYANHKGLGIQLHSNTLPHETLDSPPFIGLLEMNSSAERCGLLQEGDRIVSINGQALVGHTLIDCRNILELSANKCLLHISFDVAEATTYGSGTFQVKLFKRGGQLGITLAEKRLPDNSSYIEVSQIKKGSVAYRSGAIQTGDELVSIDNISLSRCSSADAEQILQNTDEIVKLKLRKSTSFSGYDDNIEGMLVFSVEIPRVNKSLGITISGKEQPNHPITISDITPGGIAERIGALCVGDRLLAINGKPLKGESVSYAIQQLHYGGDLVVLKICREKESRKTTQRGDTCSKEFRSGQSGDSAMEVWDSVISPKSQEGVTKNSVIKIVELGNANKNSNPANQKDKDLMPCRTLPSTSSPNDISKPVPISMILDVPSNSDILAISIYKEEHETFGFGLSNAMYTHQQGCYVCAVGKNSPADKAGLQKYDRLVQVNDVDVLSCSCNEIVPIIETAGVSLEVVVIRKRRATVTDSDISESSSLRSSLRSISQSD